MTGGRRSTNGPNPRHGRPWRPYSSRGLPPAATLPGIPAATSGHQRPPATDEYGKG